MHRVIGYRPDGKGKGTVRRISQVVKRSMGMLRQRKDPAKCTGFAEATGRGRKGMRG